MNNLTEANNVTQTDLMQDREPVAREKITSFDELPPNVQEVFSDNPDRAFKVKIYIYAKGRPQQFIDSFDNYCPTEKDLQEMFGPGTYTYHVYFPADKQRKLKSYTTSKNVSIAPMMEQGNSAAGAGKVQSVVPVHSQYSPPSHYNHMKELKEMAEMMKGLISPDVAEMNRAMIDVVSSNAMAMQKMALQMIQATTGVDMSSVHQTDNEVDTGSIKNMILELVGGFAEQILNGGMGTRIMARAQLKNTPEYKYLEQNPEEYSRVYSELCTENPESKEKLDRMIEALKMPKPEQGAR